MSIIDTTVRDRQATEPVQEQHQGRPRRSGVLIGVPVAVLGAVAATFALGTTGSDRPASPVVSNPPAAHQPGGSVYEQQVPDAHRVPVGHESGTHLYDAQVPQRGPRVLTP